MNSRDNMLQRFADAKANNAIEGLSMSADDDALFQQMINLGLDEEASNRMIDAYLAGELQAPVLAAAE